VLAHTDPGIQNWIDTCGYQEGLVSYRWVRPTEAPVPTSTVLDLAELAAHLPASTPPFSTEDRRAQIAQRRRGIARRFRH
jgi:hypothetical protein